MMRSLLAGLMALALIACSEGPDKKKPGFKIGEGDVADVDAGRRDVGPTDLGSPDFGPPPDLATPDLAEPDLGPPDLGRDLGGPDIGTADMGTVPGPADCSSANPPARCLANPNNFTWAPASIIDAMLVEGTDADPVCCFDFTGDGQIDNSLGMNLAAFGFQADVNAALVGGISNGATTLILEHQGLRALDGAFVLNWWQGAWGPGMQQIRPTVNEVNISLASAQAGTQPAAFFPTATLTGNVFQASSGTADVPFELFGGRLLIRLRRARLEAVLIAATSGVPTPGLDLVSGNLGAIIRAEDIYAAANAVAATCTCLGIGGQDLVDPASGFCNANADQPACEIAGELECANLADSCSLLSAIGLFADVDEDGDGLNDSITIGLSFSARPAQILGVVP